MRTVALTVTELERLDMKLLLRREIDALAGIPNAKLQEYRRRLVRLLKKVTRYEKEGSGISDQVQPLA